MKGSHVVVVGGGITGLAAARFLAEGGARVTVLEGSPRIGGKLRVSEIAGLPVDEGAESILARRPEGLDLIRGLGLGDLLVHPAAVPAAILSHGALRPLPAGQVMGVPSDLSALARSRVLSPRGVTRASLDLALPPASRGGDVSVAAYVGARLGREACDRLVEPLLGGVYAGRVEDLSFDATLGAVAAAARSHRSLIMAARAVRAAAPADPGPLFATLPDGLGTLPPALAEAVTAAGGEVRTGATVREVRATDTGWRLTVGSTRDAEHLDADAVVITVPARPAGRLLADLAPLASRELARIEYSSMAIVTFAYEPTAFSELPAGSGYLVPAVERRAVKAVTFSSVKWPHLAARRPGTVVLRCSIGRMGEEHLLQRDDDELKALAMTELARTSGVRELPVDTRVTRWGGGLPQYTVGHTDRIARIRADVARRPGLAVAGAAYEGVGVPACVASAKTAAARVLDHLAERRRSNVG